MPCLDKLVAFAERFVKEEPPLSEVVRAAYEANILDTRPDLSGNGEDVLSELAGMAREALGDSK